jgi:benzoate-CoA ligase family protein
MGHVLRALDVGREQRVLLALEDTSMFPVAFLGAMRIGAVPVPVSPRDTAENLRYFVEDSRAETLVCDSANLKATQAALSGLDVRFLAAGASGEGTIELTSALEAQRDELGVAPADPDDTAFWLYSSGSTGKPKGVVHQHRNIEAIAETFARQVLGITEQDRIFATSKLHHAYALGNSLCFSLYFGATAILLDGPPQTERLLQTMREQRPTVLFSVPALYALLAGDPDAEGSLDSVRLCVSASAPLPVETFERWRARFGLEILEGIGSTEMLSTYCSNRIGAVRPGTTGLPVPGYELRLVDEHGGVLEGVGTGELEVRGGSRAGSYWNQPEKERRSMRGGWFATGDRFERDHDGAYAYVGRVDEMLKVGGLWVSPTNVEEVLREHPAVADAGVIGVAIEGHPRIVAMVERSESSGDEQELAHELRMWCQERMRDYEYPHVVKFVAELPRTLTGKPRRFALRDLVEAELVGAPGGGPDVVEGPDVVTKGGTDVVELPTRERARFLLDLVRAETAGVLGQSSAARIEPDRAFKELGFDSVAAVELRNRLSNATGLRLASTLAFDHPTPAAAARYLQLCSEGLPSDRGHSEQAHLYAEEPIAIVGMSCRYPGGVRSPEDLWRLIAEGVDAISEFPSERGWDLERLYDPNPDSLGTSYTRSGGFLHDADEFDAGFFGVTPREALTTDPQQRLLLETAWEALEDAGIDPTSLHGTDTGVYAGLMYQDYGLALSLGEGSPEAEGYALLGSSGSVASGRIAYALGLEGPAVTVDTACSSSLVALHLGCQSLRSGECSLALVGGATVMATPGPFVEYSRLRGLAPDGRCKAFSDDADGTSFSEGVGVLALERLSEARRHGHRVLAIVRGSAINQDGASNGLTAPNGPSQERVIRQALANAGLSPDEIDAVEAHGTGTTLGDPIEANALLQTYGRGRERDRPLWLGSLKSNIGHSQAAAGVAGVIKMVKALEHGLLPRTLHAEEPSRHVDWAVGEVSLLTEEVTWERGDAPRRAGVSSFGVSGTNAHVILEEGSVVEERIVVGGDDGALDRGNALDGGKDTRLVAGEEAVVPWILSARSAPALRGQTERLSEFSRDVATAGAGGAGAGIRDIGLSLAGRAVFEHRAVILGGDRQALQAGLDSVVADLPAGSVLSGKASGAADGGVVFVFPGQGSQWVGMAARLLEKSPVFAERVRECGTALSPYVDWSVEDVLRGVKDAPGLDRVDVVQPTLFAVMVALAGLWRACGVEPAGVVGHSQGEIAAAYVAGGLSLEDAAGVVASRSRALAALAGKGGMLSVALGAREVCSRIESWEGRISVAAVNGPSSVVVSGDPEALEGLLAQCEADDVRARLIPVDYAAHSAHVEAIREELLEGCQDLEPRSGDVPFYSAVTGGLLDTALLDGEYWYRNLRETVQFEQATRSVLDRGQRAFIETSPHPVLSMGVQETIEQALGDAGAALVVGSLRREQGDWERFLGALGEAWIGGVAVDWARVFAGAGAGRVSLPTYAFQREKFWLSPSGLRHAPKGHAAEPSGSLARRLDGVPEEEHHEIAAQIVRAQAALVLGHDSFEGIDIERPFKDLGFDSLRAVELRNRLSAVTDLRLPATLIFDYPTVTAVVDYLLSVLAGVERTADAAVATVGTDEPIAIVGMSCRYPGGASSPQELWDLLARGADAISSFPSDRGWDVERLYDPDPDHPGTTYTREGGFLDEVGQFDAAFFGISPREALAMDPQQRLLLEASWEALEDAGVDPTALRGSRTGVYTGISGSDYGTDMSGPAPEGVAGYRLTGGATAVASGRVSYTLGLEGPAVSVDTACSSSLVALHLACGALRSGECSMALASGVTVMASPGAYIEFSAQRGLASDGRCKSFASGADGIGWSEGVGVLVVQPLSDARREGREVLAIVRGSAINQDGASNGLTAPNGPSQQRVISQALANARLSPSDVDVVEGHGTGTTLGDPIEAQALLATYGQARGDAAPLWLGSVKSNIGHSAAAAGVAGVIKMVMALRHGRLPRTLHVGEPSSEVDWSSGAISLLTEEVPWERNGSARRAGVSSFGVSGTNAHLIIEEAPGPPGAQEGLEAPEGLEPPSAPEAPPSEDDAALAGGVLGGDGVVPWVLSGKGSDGLRGQAERLAEFVQADSSLDPMSVGFSLTERSGFTHRAVVVGEDRRELLAGLAGATNPVAAGGTNVGPVLVFPGQGGQWPGMAVDLLDESPVFASLLGECERALSGFVDWSLERVLRGQEGAPGLERVDVVQPALFAVMVSLAGLWRACGVEPVGVVGHSQGEIAAAHVAGGLSLEDAARVIAMRSRALVALAGLGGMASVALGVREVTARIEPLDGRVSVAAVNGPSSVVLSGDVAVLEGLVERCESDGVRARLIPVDYAAHSAHVEVIRSELLEGCEGIEPKSGNVPFYSAVTGGLLDTALLDGEYWYRNLRETVQFERATREVLEDGHRVLVEASPHPVLSVGVQETVDDALADGDGVLVVGSMRREHGGLRQFLAGLGEAWVQGVSVDWPRVFDGSGARRVGLPTYAFQRERFWLPAGGLGVGDMAAAGQDRAEHPLLGASVGLAGDGGWLFTGRLSLRSHPWLADHAVAGTVLLPGTGLLELALYAGGSVGAPVVDELVLEAPLVLGEEDALALQVTVGELEEGGQRPISIHSRPEAADARESSEEQVWMRHASGTLSTSDTALTRGVDQERAIALTGDSWPPADTESLDVAGFYEELDGLGLEYGPLFQGLRAAWRRGEEVFAQVALPADHESEAGSFGIHPALLDSALHAAGLVMPDGPGIALSGVSGRGPADGQDAVRLPFSWSGVSAYAKGATSLRVHLTPKGDGAISLMAANERGELVASVETLLSRQVDPEQLRAASGSSRRESLLDVQWIPLSVDTMPAMAAAGEEGVAEWVLLGREDSPLAGDLRKAGASVVVHRDLCSLQEALEQQGALAPEQVLLDTSELLLGDDGNGRIDGRLPEQVGNVVCQVLEVLQGWLSDTRLGDSKLVVLSRDALSISSGDLLDGLAFSGVWGLVRSAQSENPDRFVLVDSDGTEGDGERHVSFEVALRAALASEEPQLGIREGELLVPRLRRSGSDGALRVPPGVKAWCLQAGAGGTFEDLALVASSDASEPLGVGEVRVGVRATGLNFRDVLVALGMSMGEVSIGGEGAGVVLEVGPEVEGLEVGDRVMGLLGRGIGPVSVTDRRFLARIPDEWSFVRAASVPMVFLTAYYGLVDLACLQAGEKVLVHAAAGGVGMAAVQIAQHLGAEVFATSNPRKWGTLKSLGLEETHIASSRTLEFEQRFLEQTDDGGLDVVLNSLASEFVDSSLGLLAGGGRFLEMGKTDIRDPAEVAGDRPGVLYSAFSLQDAGPDRIGEMLGELLELFQQGVLETLPVTSWDMRHAPDAFRFMSQARHVGKIVLTLPPTIESEGTVLVTGGTGELGALLARHLVVEHGVESLLLTSRRGLEAEGAAELREELESLGARVGIVACDVSDREAVRGLLEQVPEQFPLRGVVHAAGALDDGVIGSLDRERVARVLAPKVDGAWHLHELTKDLDLSMFVLFSSGAATMGAPGQGNYAAANAFLDSLAAHRRMSGLTGTSIAWGYWAQASGLTGDLGEVDVARMARQGVLPISSAEGLGMFDLAHESEQPASVAMRLDMAAVRAQARSGLLPALMSGLVRVSARRSQEGGSLAARLAGVPRAEHESLVVDLVREEVATVLGHASPAAIDPARAFKDLGFDSLAAVELRNRLNTLTGLRLPATVVFDYPNATALAGHLLEQAGVTSEQRRSAQSPRVLSSAEDLVAIVGMSCRYPGNVRSPEELWRFIADDGDAIRRFPADRGWDLEGLFHLDPDHHGTSYARDGGFLDDAADFDAEFFGIGRREALAMDPQQRLLLEASWEAFEDARLEPSTLRHSETGVFAGSSSSDYRKGMSSPPAELEGYLGTGIVGSVMSGRVAYVFGLEGPAVTVDTACSSSLTAIHLACQSLRSGECSLALAGGVTVIAAPEPFIEFSRQRGLAPDGRCKSFSDAADGTGFSEGIGLVLLERLSDARRNGHRILAVVRGSAINQDGASNGLTAPNGLSQERVIRQALAHSGLSAADVDVVEAHGTGTKLGDPIEARALFSTYGAERPDERPLWLGSVKSNIGHTQAAAGVAGVIKMVKAFEHGVLPRTQHVDEPTQHVDWSSGSVSLLTEPMPWESNGKPRRVGISSFGISGTNAHVILEEPPTTSLEDGPTSLEDGPIPLEDGPTPLEDGQSSPQEPSHELDALPMIVSGRGVGGLRGQAERLREFVEREEHLDLASACFSLAGREQFEDRAVVVGGDRDELLAGLGALADGVDAGGVVRGSVGDAGLAFMFTGQGSQRVGMGRGLYERFGVFREAFDGVCGELDELIGRSLRDVVFGVGSVGGEESAGAELGDLDDTALAQPALFAVEVALFRLVESWGVRPDYLVGHSVGEIVAAHVGGVLSLGDACALIAARGRLMGELPEGGAMASIAASEEEVASTLESFGGRVVVAAVNGPRSVVVSGDEDAVGEVVDGWSERHVKTKRLRVSHAFHSPRMDAMLERFEGVVSGLSFAPPAIPIVSNVTGEPVSEDDVCSAAYWVRHVREPVRFMDGVRWLAAQGVGNFLELGPDGVLSGMGRECLDRSADGALPGGVGDGAPGDASPVLVSVLRGERPEAAALFTGLGSVWTRGVRVDWASAFAQTGAERVDLPTYAFQRERFWLAAEDGAGDVRSVGLSSVEHGLLGAAVGLAGGDGWLFTGRVSLSEDRWLSDHGVLGSVLFPGTGFLDLALCAGRELGCSVVRELVLEAPLVLGDRGVQLQVTVGEPDEDGRRSVLVYSKLEAAADGLDGNDGSMPHEQWTRHATGVVAPAEVDAGASAVFDGAGGFDAVWPPIDAVSVGVEEVYGRLAEMGMDYGPVFQGLRGAWRDGDRMLCEVALPEEHTGQAESFGIHPALLDAALHADGSIEPQGGADRGEAGSVRLPFSWNDVQLHRTGASLLRVCVSGTSGQEPDGGSSLVAVDEDGQLVISVGSLLARRVSPEQLRLAGDGDRESLFSLHWTPISAPPVARDGVEDWVVLAAQDSSSVLRGLRDTGANVAAYSDLVALTDAIDADETSLPEVVLFDAQGLVDAIDAERADGLDPSEGDRRPAVPGLAHEAVCGALDVLQKWLSEERVAGCKLVVLSRDAISVRPDEDVRGLASSGVWGLVRSAQSENPERFALIDLDGEDRSLSALPTALACEELQLAIRAGELLAPRLTSLAHESAGSQVDAQLGDGGLGAGGTVLVTGGTGGLGALLARHLVVEHGVESLLLTSRRGLEAEGAAELREELESLGARVGIVACDVSDGEAVRGLLGETPDEFPLRGVVHAAGAVDDGVIGSLDRERVARVLAPKVDGAWHLHELTKDLDLSMFVLFSSAAATLGAPGQGNYAAANSFLDSLAAHRRANGLPAISMAWGLWEQASGLTGALTEADRARMARMGITALSAVEGLDLFDRSIAANQRFVIPARLDVTALRAQAAAGRALGFLRGTARTQAKAPSAGVRVSLLRQLASASESEREEIALELVRGETGIVLGHTSPGAVETKRTFKELGFDSLAAVELRNRLNSATGLQLAATLVFDYPNPIALAKHLLDEVVKSEAGGPMPVERELERLEAVVSSVGPDSPLGLQITSRLQALLSNWEQVDTAAEERSVFVGEIDEASDEEIFALLDGGSTLSEAPAGSQDGEGGGDG